MAIKFSRELGFHFSAPETETRDAPVSPLFDTQGVPVTSASDPSYGVTAGDALSLSTVYRSVSILANDVANLSIDVFAGTGRKISSPQWVEQPDIKVSRSKWFQQTTTSLALSGNAFWRIIRSNPADPTSDIIALIVENPWDVHIKVDGFNNVVGYRVPYVERDLKVWEVEHLTLLPVPGSHRGLGPIQSCRQDVWAGLEVREWGATYFDSAGVPAGYLSTDQELNQAQADDGSEQWAAGRKVNKTAVLGKGMRYVPLMVSPEDAQFLESQKFSDVKVSQMFGIPGRFLNIESGSSMDYANVMDSENMYVKRTLTTYTRPIEEGLSNLLKRTQKARFNFEAFLRPTTSARYEAHASGITAGWLLKSEVREIENLDPVDGIDDPPAPVAPVEDKEA